MTDLRFASALSTDPEAAVAEQRAAQYVATHDGEVCPAAWEAGQETLTPSLDLVGKI